MGERAREISVEFKEAAARRLPADESGDPRYKALADMIREETLKASKVLGGPASWRGRDGSRFFQGPSEGG